MNIDPEDVRQLSAAAAGSGIAAYIAQAKGFTLLAMFAGGFCASIAVAPTIASLANLADHESGVGFAVGFLAIMVLRKIHEVVEGLPARGIGAVVVAFFHRMAGTEPAKSADSKDEK